MTDNCNEPPVLVGEEDLRLWQDVPKCERSPFIHRFQTAGNKYVYDVNTRRIIRVLPAVWDVLDDYGALDEERIVRKYAPVHGKDQIAAAMGEIERVRQDQGIFLSFRPRKVVLPREESVRSQLDSCREQLILNVTEACNFRCTYCAYGGSYPGFRTHSTRAMPWEVARRAIDEFLAHSGRTQDRAISFYGGEPLLSFPLIRQCVLYVKNGHPDAKVRFSVTTNGSLLEGEVAAFLAAEHFLIVVSLDGPQEIHDRHRLTAFGRPSWAKVFGNVKAFLSVHPEYRSNASIRFSAVAPPSADLRQAQEFWGACEVFTDSMGLEISEQKQALGAAGPLLPDDPLVVSGRAIHKEFVEALKSGRMAEEHDRKSRWVQTASFQRPLAILHRRQFLSPHLPGTMTFLTGCVPGVRRLFVSTDGEYFACERVLACPEQLIGDVHNGVSLDRVMALLDKWAKASEDQCRFCWCLSHCNAGCLASLDEGGAITVAAKKRLCARYRRHMHHLLREYVGVLEENPKAFDYTEKFQFQ
ncbi:MAG TPA: radical SAM protein [Phycisphaerae bacterium]|nr:radical SAM protein [Phycisphaerae bacterium]